MSKLDAPKRTSGGETVGKKSNQKQYSVDKGASSKKTDIPKGTDKWKNQQKKTK